MIKLTLLNIFTIELFNSKYFMRLIFDTSKSKFSFDIKLGLFYSVLPWFNKMEEYDVIHNVTNKVVDLICPILFDLRYIEQKDYGYDD